MTVNGGWVGLEWKKRCLTWEGKIGNDLDLKKIPPART